MKLIFTILIAITLLNNKGVSQTATSITNGNWTNPLTWDCTCVPTNGYNVIVTHNVTLNTSLYFTSGGIAIANSGNLVQDASANRDVWVNGGSFENNGSALFRNFLYSEGFANNGGSLELTAFSCRDTFTNSGNIISDSLYINEYAQFTNSVGGSLSGDSIFINGLDANIYGTLWNEGTVNYTLFTNYGEVWNYGQIASYNIANFRAFDNGMNVTVANNFLNVRGFSAMIASTMTVGNNFYNIKQTSDDPFAYIMGNLEIQHDFYNISPSNIYGNSAGLITVSDSSVNTGGMYGYSGTYFQFCDLTPPLTAPFVDINTGTIDPNLTWCTAVGLGNTEANTLAKVFPNPTSGSFTIKTSSDDFISITNELGQIVYKANLSNNNNHTIEIQDLNAGIYFLKSSKNNSFQKIVITK